MYPKLFSDPCSVRGGSCNEAYKTLVQTVLSHGQTVNYGNNVGSGSTIELTQTKTSFPGLTKYVTLRPKFNLAFSLAEVLWILAGRSDVEMLSFYNKNITNFSDDGVVFNAPYGERIFKDFGDQFFAQYQKLLSNKGTRQATISIWHPVKDNHAGCKDYACNNLSQLLIRNDKLMWTQVMRSNDLIWGTPYNFVQFVSLQQIMASMLGVDIGPYTHFSNSSHIYYDYIVEARTIAKTDAVLYNSPPLKCSSYDNLKEVVSLLLTVEEGVRKNTIVGIPSSILNLDIGWQNLIVTLICFGKIKHGLLEEAKQCLSILSTGSFELMWCERKVKTALQDGATSFGDK